MATYPSELNVGDDSIEHVAVADKETWDSTQQVQSSKYVKYLEKYRQFLRLLQESPKIDLKTAHKMMSMIKSENGEDGLENMSKAAFLVKAKFILKHDMQNQPPFCPFCLMFLINIKDRNSHVRILHENIDKKFRCNSCSKTFMSKTALKYHMKVSHSVAGKVVECTQCDVTFSHSMSLKRHIKSMHNGTTGIYECPYCQKTFKRKDYVKVHCKLVHLRVDVSVDMVDTLKQDDDSYKCKCCGEVFLGSSADKDIIAVCAISVSALSQTWSNTRRIYTLRSPGKFCLVINVTLSLYTSLIYHSIRKGSMHQSAIENMEQNKNNIHSEHPRNILSCDKCEFVSIHITYLSRHKKRKHGPICYYIC